jgi:hypothetical protein
MRVPMRPPATPLVFARFARALALLGAALALLYWLADGALDAFAFHEGGLRAQLLHPPRSVVVDRLIVAALLIAGGFSAQWVLARVAHAQTDAAVQERERRFRMLIEKSADAIVLADTESRIHDASPATARLVGYQPEELVGTLGLGFIPTTPLTIACTGKSTTYWGRAGRRSAACIARMDRGAGWSSPARTGWMIRRSARSSTICATSLRAKWRGGAARERGALPQPDRVDARADHRPPGGALPVRE